MNIIKIICIGFMLTAFSATVFAQPQECTDVEGKQIYDKAYEYRSVALVSTWAKYYYNCEYIEFFSERYRSELPETGSIQQICENAGINQAELDVISNQLELCEMEEGTTYRNCKLPTIAPKSSYYKLLYYGEKCRNRIDELTEMWCSDQKDSDLRFIDFITDNCAQ
jgi:hypothetical protein